MTKSTSSDALVERLRVAVGELAPGARLPATRALVDRHHVSPVTVSRALAELAAQGLVVTRPGAGTFKVTPPPPAAPIDYGWQSGALADREIDLRGLSTATQVDERIISLSRGYLHSSLMPSRALATAAVRAARRPGAWDGSASSSGSLGLRTWLARSTGAAVDARDVTLTTGGQAAISTALRAIVPPGEPLLVESPTYPGAVMAARAAGMRTVPVPTDGDGVIPERLADAFARTRARAVYLQPTYANPGGTVLAAQRRTAVLDAAAAAGAFVVEDDYARWLRHSAGTDDAAGSAHVPPLLLDDLEGRVVYLCSLTKATSPDLRIGAIIARGPVTERLRALRIVDNLLVSGLVQETALELVSGPGWGRHLTAIGERLGARRRAFSAAVARHLPAVTTATTPRGGLHLWVRLPDPLDDVEVARLALRGGVEVLPGRPFFPAEPPAPHLRLTFSSAPHERDLEDGLRRLAAAVPALSGAG